MKDIIWKFSVMADRSGSVSSFLFIVIPSRATQTVHPIFRKSWEEAVVIPIFEWSKAFWIATLNTGMVIPIPNPINAIAKIIKIWALASDTEESRVSHRKRRSIPIIDSVLYLPVRDIICPFIIVATERLSIIGARSTQELDAETENTF